MKKNATNIIRKIHRINKFLLLKLKLTLYNTLIVPIFNYADVIWGGCYKKQAKRLQVTQNFAVRSILGKSKYDSGKEALKELKLLNLEQRRVVHESVFAHKGLIGNLPKNVQNRYKLYLPKMSTRKLFLHQASKTKYPQT